MSDHGIARLKTENEALRNLLSHATRIVMTVGCYDTDKQRLVAKIAELGVLPSPVAFRVDFPPAFPEGRQVNRRSTPAP